ncbi:cytochrome P450 6B2-like [Pseudomyrmex gracilis]|uniref:cytochrome P450 6B2-like n=1 Tax=Pseudomyrmex gracilis TaxID=219809 RepID=UPI000995668A|nr:cytochrome P450 6B2-like [Pseudomyrmex gracilis]
MDSLAVVCVIAVIFLTVFYYFCTQTFDFWKLRGVRGPKPIPIFGNMKDVLLVKISMREYMAELYRTYKDEPLIGIYARRTPILIVKDPDLIKDVLIKDFTVFAERGVNFDEKVQPLSPHLFNLESKRWRPLRTKFTPIFTSGKLKEMFFIVSECADHLEKYTETLASKSEPVECHELMAKYTTNVIGNCVFGIETNSLTDDNAEFCKMGKMVTNSSWIKVFLIRLRQVAPSIFSFLRFIGILSLPTYVKFFMNIVHETIEYRNKNNIVRHDFIDVLRKIKEEDKVGDIEITDTLLVAQAYVFFVAGFDTSSITMCNVLYELALHPKVQDKLREEVNEMYKKYGSSLTYDNVKEMQYLDKVFKETLRKYSVATVIMRKVTSNYTFNGTNVTIPANQRLLIPVDALQRDPNIYPEPDVFDPERFSDEAVKSRHPMFYLPFGDGPRNCIGSRFGTYQIKIGLVKLLRNYKFETCKETQIPYRINSKAVLLSPVGGIVLKITKIEKT